MVPPFHLLRSLLRLDLPVALQIFPPILRGESGGLLLLAVVALAPGTVAGVLWSPFLLSGRLRSLVETLDPTGVWPVTYAVGTVLTGFLVVVGFVLLLGDLPNDSAAGANLLLDGVVVTVVVLVAVGWAGSTLVAPRLGYDWDPTGYGLGTHVLVLAGAVWYAVVLATPFFLLSLVFALPT
jgi:hypothetical protein